jgi:hypothetical protein
VQISRNIHVYGRGFKLCLEMIKIILGFEKAASRWHWPAPRNGSHEFTAEQSPAD